MTIYEFDNYKDFLKYIINERGRGSVTKLAKAAGCQRSYLSQCLSSEANLTSDQVYGISTYLKLESNSTDYLLLLLEREKSSSPSYLNRLTKKIDKMRKESFKISNSFVDKHNNKKIPDKYYSAWYYSAIHIVTSIERIKSAKNIADYIGIPIDLAEETLEDLKSWKLIKFQDKSWQYEGNANTHLADSSTLNRLNHSNWRIQQLSRRISPDRDINYTSVFTVSKKDALMLRKSLSRFIEDQRRRIGESESEELVSFCCDFTRYE